MRLVFLPSRPLSSVHFDLKPDLFVEPEVVSRPVLFRIYQLKFVVTKNVWKQLVDLRERYLEHGSAIS